MIHSDNQGLVLPPKVAQTQIVIIPIKYKNDDPQLLYDKATDIGAQLSATGLRVKVDCSDTHNPGFKFSQYEIQGVPVRIELGMKDFEKQEVRVAIRHNGKKQQMPWEGIGNGINSLLDTIHQEMYLKAEKARDDNLVNVSNWNEFMDALNARKICLADWCDTEACEDKIGD